MRENIAVSDSFLLLLIETETTSSETTSKTSSSTVTEGKHYCKYFIPFLLKAIWMTL